MRTAWLLSLLVLVSACEALPKDDTRVRPIAARQAELLALENWQASGSIALSSPTHGISGSLDWQQQQSDYAITLTAALGQGLKVTQRGVKATLVRRGKAPVTGRLAENLVFRELQVKVPLRQLSFWIRGLPGSEGEPRYDRYGRLKQFKYGDPDGIVWRATVERYLQSAELDLPSLINVVGGPFEIRLIIKDWQPSITPPTDTTPGNRLTIPGVNS